MVYKKITITVSDEQKKKIENQTGAIVLVFSYHD